MRLGIAIPHDITIKPSSNRGFIVRIGCARFVAENTISLIEGLRDYLLNPDGMVEEYNKLRKHNENGGEEAADNVQVERILRRDR